MSTADRATEDLGRRHAVPQLPVGWRPNLIATGRRLRDLATVRGRIASARAGNGATRVILRRQPNVVLYLLMGCGLTAWASAGPQTTRGQETKAAPAALVGQQVTIQLCNGMLLVNVKVTGVKPGPEPGSLRSLKLKGGKPPRSTEIWASTVVEINANGEPLDATLDPRTGTISLPTRQAADRATHEAEVTGRLAARSKQLWPELTDETQADWLQKEKLFLQTVGPSLNYPLFQLVETQYFLFYTDIPLPLVARYVAYLDAMYEELTKAFRVPPGKNIWCGKCVVVAFQRREAFNLFETLLMQHNPANAAGVCHSYADGKVIIAIWKENQESFFAYTLVHETAHGFVHRFKSSVPIPTWVNEGIAEWVAAQVVKVEAAPFQRQREAAQKLVETHSLGSAFFADRASLESWQYGVALGLVQVLRATDPSKYRVFLRGLKEGLRQEESLQASYGMTLNDLVRQYSRAMGVPLLLPQ